MPGQWLLGWGCSGSQVLSSLAAIWHQKCILATTKWLCSVQLRPFLAAKASMQNQRANQGWLKNIVFNILYSFLSKLHFKYQNLLFFPFLSRSHKVAFPKLLYKLKALSLPSCFTVQAGTILHGLTPQGTLGHARASLYLGWSLWPTSSAWQEAPGYPLASPVFSHAGCAGPASHNF